MRRTVLLLACLTSACGGGFVMPTPTITSNTPINQTPVSFAPWRSLDFSFGLFSAFRDGSYTASLTNVGTSCAARVTGRVFLYDRNGVASEGLSWTVTGPLETGAGAAFSGCCFSAQAVSSAVDVGTTLDATRCPR